MEVLHTSSSRSCGGRRLGSSSSSSLILGVLTSTTMKTMTSMMTMMMMMMMMTSTGVVLGQTGVRQPPRITTPATSVQKFEKNDSIVILNCKADAIPPASYEWRFNDSLVNSTNPPGDRVSFNSDTGTLQITKLAIEQTGFYRCLATNSFQISSGQTITSTAMSHKTQVSLAFVGTSWPPATRPVMTEAEGQYMQIPCDSVKPPHRGPIEYKWHRRSDDQSFEIPPNKRIFVDLKGTLHFSYLLSTDAGDLPYACGLSSPIGGLSVMGNPVKLVVSQGAMNPIPPTLQYPTSEMRQYAINATVGSEAKLECFFSGYAPGQQDDLSFPSVIWSTDDKPSITNNDHYTLLNNGRILRIDTVAEGDEADYKCQGKLNGVLSDEVIIRLNVTSPPMWDPEVLKSETKIIGENAVFRCVTRSMRNEIPPGPPEWFKNGVRLEQTDYVVLSDSQRMLTIYNVSKARDIACFQCVVKNSVGETFSSACLNVILPIEILVRPQEEQEISKGDVVNLTVVAQTGEPLKLRYEWLFRNHTYNTTGSAPPFVHYDSETKLAVLNTSGLTEEEMKEIEGVYARRVYHTYQSVFVNVTVKFKAEVTVAAGFQYWIIGLIFGILLILLVLIICCCVICRRKMQEGDYPVDKKETAAGLDPEKEVKEGGFPDLSRAQDPNPKKPSEGEMDGVSVKDDESFGSAEYDMEPSHYTETGSFIGAYQSKTQGKNPVENPAFNSAQNPNDPRGNPRYPPPGEIPQYNSNPYPPRYSSNDYPTRDVPQYNNTKAYPPRYQNVPGPPAQQWENPRLQDGESRENPAFNANESAV